jgi:hypothetical protein
VLRVVARDRLLLVGASPLLEDIGKHVEEHPETGLQVVGYVGDREETGMAMAGGKVLGNVASPREIVQAANPDRIVVGMTERRTRMPVSELLELRFAGHIIVEAASTYEKVCGRVCLKELRPSQLIYSGELGPPSERPEIVQSLSEQIPYYRHRHCVRPGITGWAQVNYKYGDTLEDVIQKLEYDLYYIKNMPLSLDSYIIFLTIKATLLSHGSQ